MRLINPLYFIVSLCIGILIVYIFSNQPKVIMKYPTPFNIENTIYKDNNDVCYKYESKTVSCENKDITNLELQHGEESMFLKIKNIVSLNS